MAKQSRSIVAALSQPEEHYSRLFGVCTKPRFQVGLIRISLTHTRGGMLATKAMVRPQSSGCSIFACSASLGGTGRDLRIGVATSPGEVATPILKLRPVVPSEQEQARMLQSEDLGRTIAFVASMPPRVCVNEILISPTWNRGFVQTPGSRD